VSPTDPRHVLDGDSNLAGGDTFFAGSDLRKFRILDVNTEEGRDGACGVFTVELAD
jgi:hypothetical protein